MTNRYRIDPLQKEFMKLMTDFAFKRLFGSETYSHILKRFLNALFEGEMTITKIEFKDKEMLPMVEEGKKMLYDIYCTTDTGHHFILEMQQEESENFPGRMLMYMSRAIVDQGLKGVEYELDPVYCIVVTDFNVSGLSPKLKQDILLTEQASKEVYSRDFRLIFLSLTELPEKWEQCEGELVKILYLIKHMEEMTKESGAYKSGQFKEVFEASAVNRLSKDEAVAYSDSYLKELDHQSAVRLASRRAREAALAEGEAKGRAEGRAEGEAKGRAEGRAEGEAKGRAEGRAEGEAKGRAGLLSQLRAKFRSLGMGESENEEMLRLS